MPKLHMVKLRTSFERSKDAVMNLWHTNSVAPGHLSKNLAQFIEKDAMTTTMTIPAAVAAHRTDLGEEELSIVLRTNMDEGYDGLEVAVPLDLVREAIADYDRDSWRRK